MDYQLHPNEPWTPEIMDALEHAAVLVVILSPGYLASQWCQRERNAFLEMVRKRPRSSSRIFIVERDKTEEIKRPAEFRELTGYRFWVVEREGKPPRILGDPTPNPYDPKGDPYYAQLNDLSHDLAEELKRLRLSVNKICSESPDIGSSCIERPDIERADIESRKPDDRPAVFLAEVTDDLVVYRDAVKRYLDQAGIRVLQPDITLYFREPDTFQQVVDKELGNSKVFVQLLSGSDGRSLPGWPSCVHLQYERALEAGKTILQWRSPSLNRDMIADEGHRRLVEGETVWAVGLEEFKQTVVKHALLKPAVRTRSKCTLFVLLDVNREEDSPLADEIARVMEKHNIDYVLPLQHGKPSEIRTELEKFLLDSDGIIIVYGVVTPAWAREQLHQCRKIIPRRERPFKAIAVYEGPPEEKDSLGFKLADMQVIDCRKCLIEEKLIPFFESLEAEGRA
jgi:hypothetical protein